MLEIHEQPRLPLRRQIEICADGIHYRLLRSALTLSVVSLAVAFLGNVLAEVVVVDQLRQWSQRVKAESNMVDRLVATLTEPATPAQIIARLAQSQEQDPVTELMRAAMKADASQWDALRTRARHVDALQRWLSELSPSARRLVVGGRTAEESVLWLQNPAAAMEFRRTIKSVPHLRPAPAVWLALDDLAEHRQRLEPAVQRMQVLTRAWTDDAAAMKAIASLRAGDDSQSLRDELSAALQRQELNMSQAWLANVTAEAHRRREVGTFMTLLRDPKVRSVAGLPADAQINVALMKVTHDDKLAASISERWHKGATVSSPYVQNLAMEVATVQQADLVASSLAARYGDEPGFRGSALWLVFVSLLVCVVGVTNAMLISVLERFREIATMKCLGGLDSFIGSLFLMEAAFLGTLGGAIGTLLGLGVGLVRMAWSFGGAAWLDLPWAELAVVAVITGVTGVALTALSSVYPAIRAASLPPMEAMRAG